MDGPGVRVRRAPGKGRHDNAGLARTRQWIPLADRHCGGRVVTALEGGYDAVAPAEGCPAEGCAHRLRAPMRP